MSMFFAFPYDHDDNCNNNDNSYSLFGYSNASYENKGDDCGTFIGYPSSTSDTYFTVDDYEVYEVEE